MTTQLAEFARSTARPSYTYNGDITIRVPEGFSTLQAAIDSLKSKLLPSDVLFTIVPSGKLVNTSPVVVDSHLENVQIIGPTPESVNITSIISITGAAGAYDVTFALSDVSGIEAGDYLIVRGNSTLNGNPFA